MAAVRDYDLGLDLRTAAYVCALGKIYTVYKEAGITFSWTPTRFISIINIIELIAVVKLLLSLLYYLLLYFLQILLAIYDGWFTDKTVKKLYFSSIECANLHSTYSLTFVCSTSALRVYLYI